MISLYSLVFFMKNYPMYKKYVIVLESFKNQETKKVKSRITRLGQNYVILIKRSVFEFIMFDLRKM